MAYVVNPDLYDPKVAGYTSNTEYDLEYRVQYNNEIPPYDVLSLLQRPLRKQDEWKWLLGYSMNTFEDEISWNADTNGYEQFDEFGYLVQPTI
jgi:hypothetical protein